MMILLDGHSLTPSTRFQPEAMSLQLSERQSTASMTLGPAAPALSVGDWVQSESGPGGGTVWRVKTIDHQVDRDTRTVSLEHAINTLRDKIMFGEVKPADISGSSADPTAQEAAEYILDNQGDWTLGDFAYSVSNPYTFNGDDLYSALEIVSGSLEDCVWEYSFASYPFTLHIRQLSATVASEMRTDRNIRTLKKTIDRSRMYTRIYPTGKNNLHLTGDYISKNESTYGVISHTETDNSRSTEADLRAWAQERLNRHCEPAVTVTVSGLDLSEATGEPLDSFTIGKKCRIPLPEYGTTITERVVKLAYQDVVSFPEQVTVTLANELMDVATILRDQKAKSGRSGRFKSSEEEEDHAWIVDTTDKVALVAEAVAGKDGDGPNWSRVSELTVDGNGIDARVVHAEGEIVDAWAEINMTESKISMAVNAAGSEIYSSLEMTASAITSRVADVESGLYTSIQQTASGIHQTMVATTNRTWVQDTDPTTPAGGGFTAKTGDVWIESTHQGSWDGAEGFDWDHDEPYDWNQIQGAKIWSWANDKWELVSDQQQVVSYAEVVETAEHYLSLRIKGITNDEGFLQIYLAKLEQTGDELKSEIYAATSQLYSFIDQTVSNINMGVGSRAVTVMQTTQPTKIHGRDPVENDVWIETQYQDSWDAALDFNWNDDYEIDWNQLRSDKIHVYHDGAWHEALDGTVLAEDTDLEITRQHIALMARNIDTLDGYARENFAQLKVEASRISSTVVDKTNQLGSRITQTATQIRSEVYAAQSTLYSEIVQTASNIYLHVANTASGLQSSINVEADKISLVVEGTGSNAHIKPASIVTAINNGGSSVIISANHINLDGYVKATDITAAFIKTRVSDISQLQVNGLLLAGNMVLGANGAISMAASKLTLSNTAGSTTSTITPKSFLKAVQITGPTNNVYKLQYKEAFDSNWQDAGTFSRATALTGAWSSGKLTVTASPQGETFERTLSQNTAGATVSGSTITVPINATYGSSGQYSESTGWNVSVNATLAYPNSMNITRVIAGRSTSGQDTYFGKLYFYDARVGQYVAAYDSNAYWYRSGSNKSGTTSVRY